MERLNEILVELKKIEDDPFNAEKIDKMAKLNKEKNDLFAKYIEEFNRAYRAAGTKKKKEKVAICN